MWNSQCPPFGCRLDPPSKADKRFSGKSGHLNICFSIMITWVFCIRSGLCNMSNLTCCNSIQNTSFHWWHHSGAGTPVTAVHTTEWEHANAADSNIQAVNRLWGAHNDLFFLRGDMITRLNKEVCEYYSDMYDFLFPFQVKMLVDSSSIQARLDNKKSVYEWNDKKSKCNIYKAHIKNKIRDDVNEQVNKLELRSEIRHPSLLEPHFIIHHRQMKWTIFTFPSDITLRLGGSDAYDSCCTAAFQVAYLINTGNQTQRQYFTVDWSRHMNLDVFLLKSIS